MASWREEYLSALQLRDSKEKASQEIYNAYTKLADRAASLNSDTEAETATATFEKTSDTKGPPRETKTAGSGGPRQSLSPSVDAVKIRQDLGEAQRNREELQTRLRKLTDELDKLDLQSKAENKRVRELTAETTSLNMKLRDRDEELREKRKLLENVHDETLSLTIELNMANEQSQKLRKENQDLVDRWMARKGQEADAMNDASKFS